jgi:hypothetical protein
MVAPARKWLSEQGMTVKDEFATPWGICDLVAVSLNEERVRDRLRLGQKNAIGPLLRVNILNAIPEAETDKSTIIRAIKSSYQGVLTTSQIRLEIERLVARRFVRENGRGAVQKVNGWMPLHQRIVALELKLTRVQDALTQAASHQAFAGEVYVGLPTDLAVGVATSQRAVAFRSEGVGILSVGKDRCNVVLHPQAPRYPVNYSLQTHCVERFWRSRLRDSAS